MALSGKQSYLVCIIWFKFYPTKKFLKIFFSEKFPYELFPILFFKVGFRGISQKKQQTIASFLFSKLNEVYK